MKNHLLLILIISNLTSCAFFNKMTGRSGRSTLEASKKRYELNDKAGNFSFVRESGFQAKGKTFVLKTRVTPPRGDQSKVLEQSISISEIGKLKNNLPILRPKIAQYTVWFDKKKYFTQLKTNVEKRSIEITMKSPESKWNGKKTIPFPNSTGVFCFYNQLIECAAMTGFIHKAIAKKAGSMNFTVIWDGYPYFHEQYVNIRLEVFSSASLSFDGEGKNGLYRFTLEVSGQQIFYSVDKNGRYRKQFWVAQGLSINPHGKYEAQSNE
jgi:hypothetical protein